MAGNEIERIISLLNLPAHPVLPKALEIERMIRLKVPNGTLKKVGHFRGNFSISSLFPL
jgi:hypothetical protein